MKKTLVLIGLVVLMTMAVVAGISQELETQGDIYWRVSSEDSCATYFYVGSHSEPVTIMQLRVNYDLTPYWGETWEEIDTFAVNEHNLTSGECPNRRYLYKLVFADDLSLASNNVFQIRASDSGPGGGAACSSCNER